MVIFWERCDMMVFFPREPLASMVFWWFCSPLTITINYFLKTDHWTRWFFNGFGVIQPSPFNDFQPPDHCFQWFFDGFQILDTNGQRWFCMPPQGGNVPQLLKDNLNCRLPGPALLCQRPDHQVPDFIKLPDILKLIITNHFFYIPWHKRDFFH